MPPTPPPPRAIPSAGQTLLSAAFSSHGAFALSSSAGGALAVTAVHPANGTALWSAPAPTPVAAGAGGALFASPATPSVAALAGGELFVWTAGVGGGGGAARAVAPPGAPPGASLAAAAFGARGELFALEAGGGGGGLALLVGAPATPSALRRVDASEAASAAAGRGALPQSGLALFPCARGGATVALAVKGALGGVAFLHVGEGGSVGGADTLSREALGGGAWAGEEGELALSPVPVFGDAEGGGGAPAGGTGVLRVDAPSGAVAFVAVPCGGGGGDAGGAAAVVVARVAAGAGAGGVGAGVASAPAGGEGGLLLTAAAGGDGALTLRAHAIGGFPGVEGTLPSLSVAAWGGAFGGGAPTLVAPFLTPGGGLRALLAGAGGGAGVVGVKGGIAWARLEEGACVVAALALDVQSGGGGGGGGGGGRGWRGGDVGAPPSLPARLAMQAAALPAAAGGVAAWARALADRAFAKRAPTPGALQPELPAPLSRVAVTVSRTDGGGPAPAPCPAPRSRAGGGAAAPLSRGWLSATSVESGALLWRSALPLGARMRGGAGAEGSGGNPSLAAPPAAHLTWALTSRSGSGGGPNAEVLVVEAAPLGGGSSGGGRAGGWFVELTWVDGASGAVTGRAEYTAPTAPSTPTALPLTLPGSARAPHALLHGPREGGGLLAAVAPAPREWGALAALVGSAVTVAGVTWDGATGAEGLGGWVMDGGSGEAGEEGALPVVSRVLTLTWAAAALGVCGERLLAVGGAGAAADGGAVLTAGASPPFPGRAKILPGDDSLLLKYQNPHLIAALVGARGGVAGAWEAAREGARGGGACAGAEAPPPAANASLTLLLMDAVSGRVLHSRRHWGATGPVSLALHDNWVVYSFWNAAEARSELGVARLFEQGAVDTYDLTPWAKAPPPGSPLRATGGASAYTSTPPFVAHKVFVPPVSVKGLAFLTTKGGTTPPTLLATTANDGVMTIDLRLVDPRRPVLPPGAEPRANDKAEGLLPFSPFLPLMQSAFLSRGAPLHRVRSLLTMGTDWESTGLVVAYGAWGRGKGGGRSCAARTATHSQKTRPSSPRTRRARSICGARGARAPLRPLRRRL